MDDAYPLADAIGSTFDHPPALFAVEFEGRRHAWAEIEAVGRRIDALLESAGVERDAAVGLALRNRPAGYAALVGLVAARRPVALISPFQEAAAVAADVAKLHLAAVVAAGEDWTAPVIEAARVAGSAGISLDDDALSVGWTPGLETPEAGRGHTRLPGVAVQMLTSGTTGAPKRVPLSRPGLSTAIADQSRLAAAMGEAPAEAGLAAVLIQYAPMVQLSGLFTALQAAFQGKPLVLMEKFIPAECIRAVRTYGVTMLALPPAMMRMLLEADPSPEDLASVKSARSGAAPLDDHTRDTFENRYGIPILTIYGATEFIGPIASWSLEDRARFGAAKRNSVGRMWPDIAKARVVDPQTGAELPRGQSGILEVLVHRAGPDWIRTNDLSTLDEDDFLFIHGRADDAINRGGFKIPPDIISDALRTHPAVYDAAAIPLPDARLGQIPAAAVELRPGASATEDELLEYARSKLIAYQVPVRILITPALPRTPAQKVSRPGVYALFENGRPR